MDIIEQTKRSLGDFAQPMLEAGAIIPVRGKVPAAKWSVPVDLGRKFVGVNGLAFKTGALDSLRKYGLDGITVIDFDSMIPDNPNCLTKRGGHVYLPWSNDPTRQYRDIKVDQKGSGGYALFYSEHHSVTSLNLRDRSDYSEYLNRPRKGNPGVEGEQLVNYDTPLNEHLAYIAKVEGAGHSIDVQWASRALAGQMRSAAEGVRNSTLYKNVCSAYLIGGDIDAVIQAAYEAGLEYDEINATVQSALTDPQGIDIMAMAYDWLSRTPRPGSPVAAAVVDCAITQHSMNPYFCQSWASEYFSIPRSTMKRHLKELTDSNSLVRRPNGYSNGKTLPNNYTLTTTSL